MNLKLALAAFTAAACTSVYSQGLYSIPNDTVTNLPLTWTVGISAIYDDNTSPGGAFDGDDTISLNPYVGVAFASATPQTTWSVYGRLGAIYYLDEPQGRGDDIYGQLRLGVDLTHRFNERLRWVSNNYVSYELEPDYSYGFASSRQNEEYLFYQLDNALGYRWTERFATYTGVNLSGLLYEDLDNLDRLTWTFYNQFRYQLSPQTVLTATYRYSQTAGDGFASDSSTHYLLGGIEHRFSPTTVGILSAGGQFRDVDGGESNLNPFVEASLNSQINQQFQVQTYLRYGAEDYDTVFFDDVTGNLVQYENRQTLRLGVSGNYVVSPRLTLNGGLALIHSSNEDGFTVGPGGRTSVSDADETLFNGFIGASYRFTDMLTGNVSYTYTDSTADAPISGRDYDRNRFSVGVSAHF